MSVLNYFTKARILTVISLLIVTPAGFYSKFYAGPAAEYINKTYIGMLYEV